MTTAAISAPDSTVRDFIKSGVMALAMVFLFCYPSKAQEAICPLYNKGLLESIKISDLIVEIKSRDTYSFRKSGDTAFYEFEIGKILAGNINPPRIIAVGYPNHNNIPQNTIRSTGLYTFPSLTGDNRSEAYDFFLIKKLGNDYCIVAGIDVFKNLSLIDPSVIINKYLEFKDKEPSEQALGILKLLLDSGGSNNDYFPIKMLMYDWGQLKAHIDKSKAETAIANKFSLLMKDPNGLVTNEVIYLMSQSQKRTLISILLKEYDNYMQEQKSFCNKPMEHTSPPCIETAGLPCEMTVETFEWMNKCMPPTQHMAIARVLGMDDAETNAYLNNSAPIIEKARKFVESGPLISYKE